MEVLTLIRRLITSFHPSSDPTLGEGEGEGGRGVLGDAQRQALERLVLRILATPMPGQMATDVSYVGEQVSSTLASGSSVRALTYQRLQADLEKRMPPSDLSSILSVMLKLSRRRPGLQVHAPSALSGLGTVSAPSPVQAPVQASRLVRVSAEKGEGERERQRKGTSFEDEAGLVQELVHLLLGVSARRLSLVHTSTGPPMLQPASIPPLLPAGVVGMMRAIGSLAGLFRSVREEAESPTSHTGLVRQSISDACADVVADFLTSITALETRIQSPSGLSLSDLHYWASVRQPQMAALVALLHTVKSQHGISILDTLSEAALGGNPVMVNQ
ncbi:hypothetical protein KIPB_006663, partial [Kipferlia bialata]|eukprot:g6663.t1